MSHVQKIQNSKSRYFGTSGPVIAMHKEMAGMAESLFNDIFKSISALRLAGISGHFVESSHIGIGRRRIAEGK